MMSSDPHPPRAANQGPAQQTEREWRHIFDAIGHPTVILDPEHGIRAANNAVQKAAGKSEQELLGKKCYEVFHGPDAGAPAEGCPMEQMLRSGRLETVDMEMEAFGGWYLVSCMPVLDEQGRVERVIHIATDITARKRAEESLRQSEARYHALVDHMSSGVAVYEAVDDGADFVLSDFNEAGARIEQTDKADVVGRRVTEVFAGIKDLGLFDVLQRVWKTGTPEHLPLALYRDERIAGWRDNFVYRLPSGEVVAIYDDVTARRQAEERLEHLNAVLRAVRNVNQLITRERDRERLLRGVCDTLVETRGYHAAWALLLGEAGGVGLAAARGVGDNLSALAERARGGVLPQCVEEMLAEPGVHVFHAPHRHCADCPMAGACSPSSVVGMRLASDARLYGILAVCVPHAYATDADEQGLCAEMANDIAYALRQIELNEERQGTEQALRDSEEKYRALFETMAEGVVYQNGAGDIISANPAAERILGLSLVDMLGRASRDERWEAIRDDGSVFPGQEHPAMVALRTGQPVHNVMMGVYNPALNARRWILVNAVPEFRLDEAVPYRVYTTFSDITALREVQTALAEREVHLKSILRAAPTGIGVVSNRVFKEVNDRLCEMLGRSRDELLGQSARIVYPTDEDYEYVGREKYRQIAECGTGTVETRFQRKDGTILDILLSSAPIDPNDLSGGVTFTALDITERKQAEEGLRQSEAALADVLASIQDGISVLSPDLTVRQVNAVLEQWYAAKLPLEGKKCYECYHNADRPCEPCPTLRCIRSGRTEHDVVPGLPGSPVEWLELFSYPMRDRETGTVIGVVEFARDVTERKRIEEALRQREETLRTTLDQSPVGVFVVFREGDTARIRFANRQAAEIVGQSEESIPAISLANPGLMAWTNLRGDGTPYAIEDLPIVRALLRGDSTKNEEMIVVRPDGTRHWILANAAPIRNAAGKIVGSVVAFPDITERKQAEEALRDSEHMLAEAQRVAHLGSWNWDVLSDRIRWSDEERRIFGIPVDGPDLALGDVLSLVHPDDVEAARESIRKGLSGEAPYAFRSRIVRPDGTERYIETCAEVQRNEQGQPIRVLGTTLDITERRLAEEALRISEETYRSIFNAATDAIFIHEVETGRILDVNAKMLEMFACGREEAVTLNVGDLSQGEPPYDQAAAARWVRRAAEEGPQLFEWLCRRRDGTLFWSEVTLKRAEIGGEDRVLAVVRDISERKRVEEALQQQAAELARSNAELEQFAYVASHDLQEPLRKITSYLQLLEERYRGRLDAGADEFIGFAVDGSQRMKKLISDLLEYSRVGTRGRPFEATDAGVLLERVLADLQMAIDENRAEVTSDSLPTVLADGVQLGQVFQNLISNALKFRRDESPCIHISAQPKDGEWVFSVRDNGLGLDPAFKERIFAMFQRLHGRGKYPGTGIGLALCKKIVERHGGRIWIESEPGRGTTFYFTLPAIRGER
ncbi:MAG: PAS domain S-box protein [Verrucomicrobia bacterium]|nr:PAS domain S-box protein [Verrucomicrobiota bacterium]